MSAFTVHIKHGANTSLQLDPEQPPSVFKEAIYQVTGVPVDRMKVMIKGALLKQLEGVNPKAGQTFTVIGTAGPLPKPPSTPIDFFADMDERELASVSKTPVGLQNLGNTCYMNSTVQALRAIPELQTALDPVTGTPTTAQHRLAMALRETYKAMGKTTEGFPPLILLTNLRAVFPQFAEQTNAGHYAQQDAEECWSQMISAMKTQVPGLTNGSGSASKSFIEQYMVGEMRKVGIKEVCEQFNPALAYITLKKSLDETSRISRLPSNLTVHMVRFYWRRDINKKAKIMRKVKFPFEFDALDLLTDELREKIQPATRKLLEIEGDRLERRRARRKLKNKAISLPEAHPQRLMLVRAEKIQNQSPWQSTTTSRDIEDEATAREREKAAIDAVIDPEVRGDTGQPEREKAAIDAVIDPEVRGDTGAAVHALFELTAIVTHKGASADGGHYIGWEWYKFDDDKVSVVTREKISTLDGGGEDSTAYLLLYRAKPIY
ncbi:ubiquitin carboxyl-terminal hydrolase [Rhizoctonia solani]|uniref:Ubiquitin carboxyl-terminal hydrolase n=1 Tax=Rhizoctonia solani TaxID=456999 RepID=A0A8H8P4W7_9AGAM|nr:ubiquitin carboxyl-terminal hydrolase [Rhizoctonia solani]QRW24540.1 ubiquitin carboxyl-terminal hydrolase [Rhizoctonia solani]